MEWNTISVEQKFLLASFIRDITTVKQICSPWPLVNDFTVKKAIGHQLQDQFITKHHFERGEFVKLYRSKK